LGCSKFLLADDYQWACLDFSALMRAGLIDWPFHRILQRGHSVPIFRLAVLIVGLLLSVVSLLFLGFAALGFLGILADVGDSENREIGMKLLRVGLPALIVGLLVSAFGAVLIAVKKRSSDRKEELSSGEES
jgi:hypothetical protein